ncbi:MAG: hypothetical protein GKC05_07620 [Methanomicrobiales archaeon]|nr:hypothetical protein [Methanomicrobiales archaeon]NYT20438.1 hypothetical protein [Methanomicrobiales archaeon]
MRTSRGFILVALLCLLISCSVCQTAEAGLFPERDTRIFTSRNYGISFEYPDDWTIESEKFIPAGPAGIDRQILRLRYENTTNGFVLAVSVSREDIDPALLPSNFTGSEECGYIWNDDRPNCIYIEGYHPASLGGVKAWRSMALLNNSGNQTVETLYEVCTSYRSGRTVYSWFFWSVPADEYFTVQPVIGDVLDSVRLYEPMGLFNVEGILDQASLDFPEYDEGIYDTFTSSEFGLSFPYPRGWRITSTSADVEHYPRMEKGMIQFSHLPDDISLEIDTVRYDFVDSYRKTQPFMNETVLCSFDCPECHLILKPLEPHASSGSWWRNATIFLEKNNEPCIEEIYMLCPVRTPMSQSGYRITYSVPAENWETVRPFMHGFVRSIKISPPL